MEGLARRLRSRATTPVTLGASVALHVALVALAARLLMPKESAASNVAESIEIDASADLPRAVRLGLGTPAASARVDPRPPPNADPRLPGAETEPRPDTLCAGRGGTISAREAAVHLSDSIDGLSLTVAPTRFTPTNQLVRFTTSRERASPEDRRALRQPMELSFIAVGTGSRTARTASAPSDPAQGAFGGTPRRAGAAVEGVDVDVDVTADGERFPLPGATASGDAQANRDALGIRRGTERADYQRSAAVAVAHPATRDGRESISTTRRGRPSDTVTSTQAVARFAPALLDASTAGGPRGEGPGGTSGDRAPGRDGRAGQGSHSRAAGEGGHDEAALELGIRSYAASVTKKVYPYWEDAFPIWARAEGRGGVAVIGVTLSSDGSVRELRVLRGSGIAEFDHNVALALEQASPYGPLPPSIRASGLTLNIAFDAMNPAVGRSGPGPGQR